MSENTELINQLKGVPGAVGSVNIPYGEAIYNPNSDYLVGHENGKTLTVTINRDTSVPLYYGVQDYGKRQPTGDDAILDINLGLPDRAK